MPTNKNAIIRYQALDRCFSDFLHRYYMEDLIEACAEALYQYTGYDSVSRRTVFDDITFMESEQGWSIPLERLKMERRFIIVTNIATFPLTSKNSQLMSLHNCVLQSSL